jgi:hypothetical protein
MFQQTATGQRLPAHMLIASSNDPQIQESYNKLLTQQLKADLLKEDLALLSSPEGAKQYVQATKARAVNEKAAATLAKPTSTLKELEAALKTVTDPEIKAQLEQAIVKTKQATASTKQAATKTAAEAETTKKGQEATKEKKEKVEKKKKPTITPSDIQDPTQAPFDDVEPAFDDYNPDVDAALDNLLGPSTSPIDVAEGQRIDVPNEDQLEPISKYMVTERLEVEAPGQDEPMAEANLQKEAEAKAPIEAVQLGAAKTVLKEIAGEWKDEEVDGQVVSRFVIKQNPDTTPEREKYYESSDAKTKIRPYEAWQVFDAQGKILTVNTPNVNIGDKVGIVVEPDWKFWKNKTKEKIVMNVYALDENGKPKGRPLTQIPAGDNPRTSNPGSIALREAVWKAYQAGKKMVTTTIVSKNYGDLLALRNADGTKLENNLSVLETDMIKTKDGWREGTTPHAPILAFIDSTGSLQVPNVDIMRGMDPETASLAKQTRVVGVAPGTILTLRRMGTGGFVAAQVDPRKLTTGEVQWLKDNLAQKLFDRQYADIKTLLNIKQVGIEAPIAEQSKTHLLNIAGDIAFFVKTPKTEMWVKINATNPVDNSNAFGDNFGNFMRGDEYNFQVYYADGTKHSNLQHSANVKPEVTDAIRKSFDQILQNSFKNVDKNFLNTEGSYIDITGENYKNYYEYLKSTNSVTTDLPAGYSIFNTTIYLDPNIEEKSVV